MATIKIVAGSQSAPHALRLLEVILARLEKLQLRGAQAGQRIAGARSARPNSRITGRGISPQASRWTEQQGRQRHEQEHLGSRQLELSSPWGADSWTSMCMARPLIEGRGEFMGAAEGEGEAKRMPAPLRCERRGFTDVFPSGKMDTSRARAGVRATVMSATLCLAIGETRSEDFPGALIPRERAS